MTKSNELTLKRALRRGAAATRSRWARAAVGWVLAVGCGGTATTIVTLGSESHFLAYCESTCEGGLDCIGGICTRSCMTGEAECADFGAAAECTNQSVEPGEVAVCDVRCTGSGDCQALGSGYECHGGYCRTGTRAIDDGVGGSALGGGGNPDAELRCEDFRDEPRPISDTESIRIVNEGPEVLYLQPGTGCREAGQALVSVQRDGQYLELSPICVVHCERVLNEGWGSGAGEGNTENHTCPYLPCERSPVQIAPGETLVRTSTLEYAFRRLPRECADGIETEAINCLSLVSSPPGNYTLQVRAGAELACRSDSDCDCRPGLDGTCTNGNVYLARTPLVISADVPQLQGQTVTISRERGCNELRDRILAQLEEQVDAGVLLPTAVPCPTLSDTDFDPSVPSEQVESISLIFRTACADFESVCTP